MPNYLDGTLGHARRILGVHAGKHRVTKFNRCVGAKLSGAKPGNRPAVHKDFAAAARSCKGA